MSLQIILTCPNSTAKGSDATASLTCIASTSAPQDLRLAMRDIAAAAQRVQHADYRYYSYRVVQSAGTAYHILCRHTLTGNRAELRHIHAILLPQHEVTALCNNAARPTPAGVILALENKLFWRTDVPEKPAELDTEPVITASALPDASTQATWKQHTGHKSNARALFAPPYDRECLLVLPQGIRPEEVLGLLHESDWLTSDRGWGHTFTTSGGPGDLPSDVRRIALPYQFPRTSVQAWEKLPVLVINNQLSLDDSPVPGPLEKAAIYVEKSGIPYSYEEASDNEAYPYTRPPLNRLQRLLIAICGLLALSFCINLLVYGTVDDAGALAGKAIVQNEVQESVDDTAGEEIPLPPAVSTEQEPPPAPDTDEPPPAGADAEDTPEDNQSNDSSSDTSPWRISGQQLPRHVTDALSAGQVKAKVYPLSINSRLRQGVLLCGDSPQHFILQSGENQGDVQIALEDNVLRSVTYNGEAAAVLLGLPQGDMLLIPRLHYSLGNIHALPTLPIIQRIRVPQMAVENGALVCSKFPSVKEGSPIPTSQRLNIPIPTAFSKSPTLLFESAENIPLRVNGIIGKVKAGCCTIPVSVKLLLANPFYQKIPDLFQEITRQTIPDASGQCTCATLFLVAEKLAAGQLDPETLLQYTQWRTALQDVFADLPDLSDVEKDERVYLSKRIKESVCSYINNTLGAIYQQQKEQAEAFNAPVELTLERLQVNEKGEICWIFVLQAPTLAPHEP